MRADPPPVVAVRTVFRGRVWSAIPNYLIEEAPERVVTALLPGARCQRWTVARAEVWAALAGGRWKTAETTWHTHRTLWIWPRGAHYMVGHFWEDATDRFQGWYLNLQTPLRRSPVGFDLWDQVLDVVVRPDRTWSWKDEDECAEATRLGVLAPGEAAAIRAEGERLIARLDEIVPTGWEDWRPHPGWPPLVLPAGWDRVEERPAGDASQGRARGRSSVTSRRGRRGGPLRRRRAAASRSAARSRHTPAARRIGAPRPGGGRCSA
jgi:predicted RNA-binding protein associated with RNAse of E/G family